MLHRTAQTREHQPRIKTTARSRRQQMARLRSWRRCCRRRRRRRRRCRSSRSRKNSQQCLCQVCLRILSPVHAHVMKYIHFTSHVHSHRHTHTHCLCSCWCKISHTAPAPQKKIQTKQTPKTSCWIIRSSTPSSTRRARARLHQPPPAPASTLPKACVPRTRHARRARWNMTGETGHEEVGAMV